MRWNKFFHQSHSVGKLWNIQKHSLRSPKNPRNTIRHHFWEPANISSIQTLDLIHDFWMTYLRLRMYLSCREVLRVKTGRLSVEAHRGNSSQASPPPLQHINLKSNPTSAGSEQRNLGTRSQDWCYENKASVPEVPEAPGSQRSGTVSPGSPARHFFSWKWGFHHAAVSSQPLPAISNLKGCILF